MPIRPALAPRMRRDADELDGFLEFLAGEVSHPGLSALVAKLLGDAEIRKAMRALPAAESHHSYAGGLLEHTVGVATLAARPPSSIRGCAPTSCSRPRSSTTSAGCAS